MAKLRAVVLGARFGGLATVSWLRRLKFAAELEVIVVDRWQETVYRPALVQAMALGPAFRVSSMNMPLARFWRQHRVEAVQDTIVGVDPERREVFTASSPPISYDVLFVATGSEPAWDGILGLGPHRGGVCEGYQARHAARLNESWQGGHFVFATGPILGSPNWDPPVAVRCEPPLWESALLFEHRLRQTGRRQASMLTVLTPGSEVAEAAGPQTRQRLKRLLVSRGIRILTGVRFQEVTDREIVLADQRIPYDRALWIPPCQGSSWAQSSGISDRQGWIPTDHYLNHPEFPAIYAVGDVISHSWPKNGHAAMVQARVAVHHWQAKIRGGRTPAPYRPELLWILDLGGGQGLFSLGDTFYGGHREVLVPGRSPYWAKHLFQAAYIATRGALPIMP